MSGSFWANIVQENHLCNVGPWQTDNVYEENNLCNVVSTMLGRHCIEILSSQYCPNTSEITLHKEITCTMLAQSAQTRFRRKITYTMLSDLPVPTLNKKLTWVMPAHSPQTNLHRKIIYNFVWIYLGQHCIRKLPVECWPMAKIQLLWGR